MGWLILPLLFVSVFCRCEPLPTFDQLKAALTTARGFSNGGFNLDMWGTIVDRDGNVCVVAYTGNTTWGQWPGSRVISAQKANTANAFSLDGLALSSANLYTAVQPGGSLFGLQESNPVDESIAYRGSYQFAGTRFDPMVNGRIGGINVFGGGLALYNDDGKIIGGLGVSGDSSCADHNIAWHTRSILALDYVTAGVGPAGFWDNIQFTGAWSQPHCVNATLEDSIVATLPGVRQVSFAGQLSVSFGLLLAVLALLL